MKNDYKLISVIIPAYNCEGTILGTINSVKKFKYSKQIIVVNDGSKDKTEEIVKNEDVELISLKKNCGKGAALQEGVKKAKGDVILFLDSDLGETAREGEKLADELLRNMEVDIVCGSFSTPGGFGILLNFTKFIFKVFFRADFNSPLSGQKAIRKSVALSLLPFEAGYGVEVGILIKAIRKGYKIVEIPVNMDHNRTGKDIKGIIHRAIQFKDIMKVFLRYLFFNIVT